MPRRLFGLGRPSASAPHRVGPIQADVLRVVRNHPEHAHGVGIAGFLRDHEGSDVSDAQIYIALQRLDARDLVVERAKGAVSEITPSASRRGRPRKLYSLTASGKRALEGGAAMDSKADTDAREENSSRDDQEAKGLTPVVG